jgi:hypothetical protein
MFKSRMSYIQLISFHVLLGLIIYYFPFLAKIYAYSIVLFGFYYVIKTQNKNNEVLYVAAYIVGVEVFLRMTKSSPNYEFSKYLVTIFMLLGMYYRGLSKNAIAYWIFLILLIPGIIIATQTFSLNYPNIRKSIIFNISGPVCLGVCSLYCYFRKISINQLNTILLFVGLPIISTAIYIFFYTPNLKETIVNTSSNSATSGGFGPNQVSTLLGLGMFIFFSRVIFESKSIFIFFVNSIIFLALGYRGLLTFSRGGLLTGLVMIIILFLITYLHTVGKTKVKMLYLLGASLVAALIVWTYSINQTGGLIAKRYQNKDAMGRDKESNFSGREKIAGEEVDMFLANPFLGVGVARSTDIRSEGTGGLIASHDEITRLMAEHGSLGILALLILVFTPLFLYLDNKQHLYLFSFLIFWFFTINHAAMRTASPAFIYALSLLKISFNEEKASIHRK